MKKKVLINTLLIMPIFVLMLYSTPKSNWEIVASVVWSVKGHKGVPSSNY